MRKFMFAAALVGGLIGFGASEADAFVCASGPYRAGCIGPGGAIGVRRPYGYYGGVYRGPYGGVGYRGPYRSFYRGPYGGHYYRRRYY